MDEGQPAPRLAGRRHGPRHGDLGGLAPLALAIPKLNEMILAAVNSIGLVVALSTTGSPRWPAPSGSAGCCAPLPARRCARSSRRA
ncbi:hypothetical protein [Streptomyces sp. KL116D]|uniref:hypothetical protein n=1 Tax=Streptomyces sp. KL116D TaxID=3045152 RepID=UPI003557E401